MVAQVLVEIKNKNLDHTFDYKVCDELQANVAVGKRVLVPFGSQNVEGFILNIKDNSNVINLKSIISVIDEEVVLNEELLELGDYISKKTLSSKISALQTMVPRALKANKKIKINKKMVSYIRLIDKNYIGKNDKQKKLISLLNDNECLKSSLVNYASVIKTLIKNNVVVEERREAYRLNDNKEYQDKNVVLNNEQLAIVEEVTKNNSFVSYLLYGVTGSGKTETYMHIIKKVLDRGKQAIVLVPEISLTPQLVNTFKARFNNTIAVLHSGLSDGEKYDEWRKIVKNEVSIVIGARSAVFAPFNNIGVIIIDEEHTPTYKQDNNPRYYAIDVALKRAKKHNCPLILGSATPSLESFTRAKVGVYKLLKLTHRVNNNLPKVELVDMANEIKKGNRIISSVLKDKIVKTLAEGNQVILLLNRRGYSTTVSCHDCGYRVTCPNCDIPITYHKKYNTMKCHYCDYTTLKPFKCPECKSDNINQFGLGTERLEEEVNKLFIGAKTIRMDIDTTRKKGSYSKIFEDFINKKYNILVGTQMISKGLDFEDVTLVGVINGDASLNIPDFRSSERTYSLLNQVAGRAGRGTKTGEVVIQGFNLNHYSILKAKMHDYLGFYEEEMKLRKILKYPPYYNLAVINIVSSDYNNCYNESNKIADYLKKNLINCIILGPSNSFMPKINNNYYMQIMIKYKKSDNLYKELKFINQKYPTNKVKVEIDINPIK